ncbi:hypothetical protein BpHYR1_035623 [Brachionus plicatilis]|uniref:Uncharacterized protein n=1 Tax=Brachionus plicatilis TaxID=10195 RepID=A0A3M7RPW6_BRAPC|nr:hypothetical protein BpHYR1_035623 [Brachionus plicatilis]
MRLFELVGYAVEPQCFGRLGLAEAELDQILIDALAVHAAHRLDHALYVAELDERVRAAGERRRGRQRARGRRRRRRCRRPRPCARRRRLFHVLFDLDFDDVAVFFVQFLSQIRMFDVAVKVADVEGARRLRTVLVQLLLLVQRLD